MTAFNITELLNVLLSAIVLLCALSFVAGTTAALLYQALRKSRPPRPPMPPSAYDMWVYERKTQGTEPVLKQDGSAERRLLPPDHENEENDR